MAEVGEDLIERMMLLVTSLSKTKPTNNNCKLGHISMFWGFGVLGFRV